ncbi:hypothetical protein DC3_32910 [Deinococcus cellulosilyticus NBRC 106333 = KACC 11606]|uniref:CidA/LrgA family protein n=1 Tax=Deinococcus cellulosilyticus (strain DSM 18568 / NBRC 106333 / KACC 11606 / 5516J-15) TaxID=1223518 RepID=A0A511N5E8_DEIC1|nr:hypothetical protein DC3_32910 [Deinococcus cellulosilyticus NBRC 106333 = KACC 11606]
MLRGFCILLGFNALGEMLTRLLHLPIPGPVVGMLLLWAALNLKLVRLEWVQKTSEHLLSILGLLFVPAGAGIVLYLQEGQTLLLLLISMTGVLFLASFVMTRIAGRGHD